MLQGWQARLNLTEAQKTQTKGLLEQLGQQLEPLADKVDAGKQPNFGLGPHVSMALSCFCPPLLSFTQEKKPTVVLMLADNMDALA